MTPEQCRAARALVGMTQPELARHARVGLSTVANFEAGRSVPMAKNLADIRATLEDAGVELLNNGQPGVRLTAGAAKAAAMTRAKPTKPRRKK